MRQHVGPDGVLGIRRLWDDPEALVGVVDEGDGLAAHRRDGPVAAQEIQRVVGIEPALKVESQVEIQQGHGGDGPMVVALFLQGQVPGGVGGQAGGATLLVLVVPGDLGLEQGVGVLVVGDLLVGQEADQALLQGVEAAFDFAFGLGVGGDAVGGAQGGEGALELGVGVEAIGGGAVAKEGEAVGVEAGGRAVLFDGLAQMSEVTPGGVAGREGAGEDFTGMIVEGQQERGIGVGGPPGMGRGVVLPEFADGGALPAAAGFGAAFGRGQHMREVLPDVGSHGGTGAAEVEAAGQFVGQEGEVEGLTVGQEIGQEGVRAWRASRGGGRRQRVEGRRNPGRRARDGAVRRGGCD